MTKRKTYNLFERERGFSGPYTLTRPVIARTVERDDYGAYLLVDESRDGDTIVVYVGRCDIRDRLTEHLDGKDASAFYFKLLNDDKAGFEHECNLYHKYGGHEHLDNQRHPPVPEGSPKNYPKCSLRSCSEGLC